MPVSSKNLLETALDAAFTDPSRQGGVETALLASELYVSPTGGRPPEGVVLGRDAPFRLNGIVLKEGHNATAAFTRTEFATNLFGEPASMAIRGRHLLEAFEGGWIVLNPGQEKGLVLTPADIAAILASAGNAQPTVEDPNIELTTPDPVPSVLVARMKDALDHPSISSAWLARTRDRTTGEAGWRMEVYGDLEIPAVRKRVEAGVEGLNFDGEHLDLLIGPASDAVGAGIRII
ncbi:SseB family protein [Brevundimonas nasdae]|uniref:SseB family protein n=1 Tax=Brevundimonas nasdae TaxID=172043 RepID=UPI003F6921F1